MPKYLVTLHLDSWAGMREPGVKRYRVTRPTLEAATARGNYLREEMEAVGVTVTPIETEEP